MQFIPDGPDIPEQLLQAHEEGRVVFFCGAGISCPAGLPLFGGLVQGLAKAFGEPLDSSEQELFEKEKLDQVLGRYEKRVKAGRVGVRQHLSVLLTPDLTRPFALTTHRALLELGRNRSGELRLVTTNFDRLFEKADRAQGPEPVSRAGHFGRRAITVHPDPPVRSRWEGVVHLHGRLPEHPSSNDLDRLVIADSDFGRAYLTEGWAARFVAGLLRDFTLCFVGYSIDDPVMPYMSAAYALDGEGAIFAFAPWAASTTKSSVVIERWKAKHVTPILYDDQDGHRHLHRTLRVWASLYRDGIRGKQRLVARYAQRSPAESNEKDDFVGRMLWALADPSGKPAKRFAELNPVAPLEWLLEAFCERRFQQSDLSRFGVAPHESPDNKLRFSLLDRPAPHHRSTRMHLVAFHDQGGDWDDVMGWLAEWLLRHLDDPRLLLWIARSGGQLHPRWLGRLEDKLRGLAALELDGNSSKLETIRQQAPNAIPGPLMRVLWGVLVSGRLYAQGAGDELWRWLNQLQGEGLNASLRLQLRDLLAPRVHLGPPRLLREQPNTGAARELSHLVSWDLRLASDDVHTTLLSVSPEAPHWQKALPFLLSDLQQVLQDALDLHHELGRMDSQSAPAGALRESIHSSKPRSDDHNWVNVILLLRDSWLAVLNQDADWAARIARGWAEKPNPTFHRLALFAASKSCLPTKEWVEWLLANEAQWLWASDTEQEVHQLLAGQGDQLADEAQERMEEAILAGPSPAVFAWDGLEPMEADRWIWECLTNLNTSGLALGEATHTRLLELNPTFQPQPVPASERVAPRKRQELMVWLTAPKQQSPRFAEPLSFPAHDPWAEDCIKHPFPILFALTELGLQGNWLVPRWKTALSTWARRKQRFIQRLWQIGAPNLQIQDLPDAVLQKMALELSQWVQAVSEEIQDHEAILLSLCQRLLALPVHLDIASRENGNALDYSLTLASSHPVGRATRAIINIWLHRQPKDNDGLPEDVQPLFTRICDATVERFRYGRVLLGSRLLTLFRVDQAWTETHLLPLLSWANPTEAGAVWQGFLWSPRLNPTLWLDLKADALSTAEHYNELGPDRDRFAACLTQVALNQPKGFSVEEFRSAFAALPPSGLEAAAQELYQALEAAGDQREAFWDTRVKPFWEIWPKSQQSCTRQLAKFFALLVLATGSRFPEAVTLLQAWLQGSDDPHVVVQRLNESDRCSHFPEDALSFLHHVVDQSRPWRQWQTSLRECLVTIKGAAPPLANDPRFRKLWDYAPGEH
ncbi:MAG: SIR2 family protein [Cyanobium sp.]